MFFLYAAGRSLWRCRYKSILSAGVCALAVLLLNLYMGNFQDSERMLERLPGVMEVSAYISNLEGTLTDGLKIKESIADGITASEYVENAAVSVQLMAGFGEFPPEEWKDNLTLFARAANCVEGMQGLIEDEIVLEDGVSADFLSSDRRECLVDEIIMENRNLHIGDTVTFTIYYLRYEGHELLCDPLDVCEYRIAGSMHVSSEASDSVYRDVLFPLEAVRRSYRSRGIPFFASSCQFDVKNPLELNAFKEQMHELGMLPVMPAAKFDYDGNALTVKDETFIKAAERILESQTLLRGFFPLALAVTMGIGYLSAHLFTQSRRQEYALLRSLGTGRGKSFLLFFTEYFCLAFVGGLAGSMPALWIVPGSIRMYACAAAMFGICYLAGAAVELLAMGRLSVMDVLARND